MWKMKSSRAVSKPTGSKRRREKTRALKQAMIQQLLTGQIRLV